MNLRDLEYLIAIDNERHFHKAAERCFVSQPTLSGQLKKLEEELGVKLVERSTRQVVMTDVGSAIANQARKTLAEAKAIKELAQSFHDPMVGQLQVGLIPTVAPYLLPIVMPLLSKNFPQLKLWLHEYQTRVLLEKLRNAELDLLILALPVETDEFVELALFNEPFWLAAPRDEPLTQLTTLTLEAIQGRTMMLLQEGHCLREHALDVCFAAGAKEAQNFHATSLETLRHMVGEGMGMTLMPQLAVPKLVRDEDSIRYLPFCDPQPTRRIGMLYRGGSYRAPTYQRLAEVIRSAPALTSL